jgi:hypothetical protein
MASTRPLLPSTPAMSTHAGKTRTVKVAIVGSGLAGLTAGYLLTQPIESSDGKEDVQIEVHLFEKASPSSSSGLCCQLGAYGAVVATVRHFGNGLGVCVYSGGERREGLEDRRTHAVVPRGCVRLQNSLRIAKLMVEQAITQMSLHSTRNWASRSGQQTSPTRSPSCRNQWPLSNGG